MTEIKEKIPLVTLILCLLFMSCDGDNATGEEEEQIEEHTGRGTPACQEWQAAYCEYAYVTCDFGLEGTYKGCLEQYSSLVCSSDEVASSCSELFQNASCTEVPEYCNYYDVLNAEPAIEQCNKYVETVCEMEFRCFEDPVDDCIEKFAPKVGCDEVIGTFLVYEENMSCEELIPDKCNSLFLISAQ